MVTRVMKRADELYPVLKTEYNESTREHRRELTGGSYTPQEAANRLQTRAFCQALVEALEDK